MNVELSLVSSEIAIAVRTLPRQGRGPHGVSIIVACAGSSSRTDTVLRIDSLGGRGRCSVQRRPAHALCLYTVERHAEHRRVGPSVHALCLIIVVIVAAPGMHQTSPYPLYRRRLTTSRVHQAGEEAEWNDAPKTRSQSASCRPYTRLDT